MKTITKALVGTVAAGAVAMASATPAYARDRDGIGAGEIIAGALIIGGIAAVAAAASNDRNDYDGYGYRDRRGYDNRYYGAGSSRDAVEMCVRTAESNASRYSYGGRANVTDIRTIDRKRDGYTVKGRIAVNTNTRGWRNGDNRYGRGWNNNLNGYDSGRFTCKVRYGRVVDLDYSGIRGL